MLTEIPRDPGAGKARRGTWAPTMHHTPEPEFRPFWSAMVCCPDCGKLLSAINHSIDANGQISPSLGHPTQYGPCGWHTNPRLIGWEPQNWPLPPIPKPETCALCSKVSHTLGSWAIANGGLQCAECFAGSAEGNADAGPGK